MGKKSLEKGKRWEREVATLFAKAMPGTKVKRGFQRIIDFDESDVVTPWFWVECKVGKLTNPRAGLQQAKDENNTKKVPICCCKDDRKEPFVILELSDFLRMVNKLWNQER